MYVCLGSRLQPEMKSLSLRGKLAHDWCGSHAALHRYCLLVIGGSLGFMMQQLLLILFSVIFIIMQKKNWQPLYQ